MSVSESDKFSDLDEEGSAREQTTGISGLSIPDLIQGYDDEEIFSGRDPLGEFERDHVLPHLRYQSPEPVRTPSPKRKRGGSTDEPSSNERGVGDEQQRLRLPSNDLTLQDTAGIDRQLEEGPSNPLSARERAFAVWKEKEEFLRSAFLFLQDDVYPTTNKLRR
jgi:hypothetical protein